MSPTYIEITHGRVAMCELREHMQIYNLARKFAIKSVRITSQLGEIYDFRESNDCLFTVNGNEIQCSNLLSCNY